MTATEYLETIGACVKRVEATDAIHGARPLDVLMQVAVERLRLMRDTGGEVHLIGNGGSAAIVEHAQVDFVKAAGTRARVHNDIPMMTAYANDVDYSIAWATLLTMLMRRNDVLIAVSSSGESASILNAVCAASRLESFVMTLSGFESTNRLRQLGDLNFYVPSMDYGHVELTHAALLHHITDEVARA